MKRKVRWIAIALLLFDVGFVSNARASRRSASAARRAAVQNAEMAPLRAQQFYPLMNVTVLTSVQLPDQVLTPGKYTFVVLPSGKNVSIIRDGNEFVGTYLLVPAYRHDAQDGLVNTADAPDGGPDRIVSWFFPYQQDGYSFIYSSL